MTQRCSLNDNLNFIKIKYIRSGKVKKVTTFNSCREKYIAFKERYQKTPLGKCIDEIMV